MFSMSLVDLSICIVNWNRRDLLQNLLASLKPARAGLNTELILVDNASSDGSAEMVAADFPDVVLVRNTQNLGFSKANNQAVARARGRLLLFLNNDTIVRPGTLAQMVKFLDEHPDVVAVGPRLTAGDGQPRDRYMILPTLPVLLDRIRFLHWTRLFHGSYQRYRRGRFNAEVTQAVGQIPGSAVMVRKDQFLACGGWDEGFEFGCEDFDLSARLKEYGLLYYVANAEIVHLGGKSSRANLGFVYRGYECGCARYLGKHSRLRAAPWIYKALVTMDMPMRLAPLAARYAASRLKGESERAARTLQRLTAASHFYFRNLVRFWRS